MTSANAHKRGYKHTPVGWIPEEWECSAFGDIITNSEYGLSIGTSEDGWAPIIGMSHIQDGCIKVNKILKVNISEHEFERYRLRTNDLLFNRTNSAELVGKSALVIEDMPYVFASYLVRFRLMSGIYPRYIGYYFSESHVLKRIRNLASPGVSQYNINPTTLRKNLLIPLPPFPEQKKIAEILSTWDKAIEQVRALIEQKKLLKKGLMQQLLTGRMRFPQFGKPLPRKWDTYYDYPIAWANIHIGDISKETNIKNLNGDDITVLSCSKYAGFVDSLEYFGKKVYSDDTSNYKLIREGEFGFPSNHIEEGSIGLLQHKGVGIVSPIYTVFSVNQEKVNVNYLYSLFKTELYRHIFSSNTSASVDRRGSLRWKEFSKIKVPLPCIDEQDKIADLLAYIELEIQQMNSKLTLLQEQKRGLMQKLLTGEVRTVNSEQ